MAGYDGLIMPTVAVVPPPMTALETDEEYVRLNRLCLRNTLVANFLNGCAISLPMHEPGAAPAGLMLMAPEGWDRRVFSVAAAIEPILREAASP
jgi:aspartyl-tRNA(Asn)/glutamyl-tRNA(Gln) amidotransferase subunit A